MYKKVDTGLDFVPREIEVLNFWKDNKVFEKTVEKNKGKKPFSFYDGPPTANGKPHIGHVLTRAMKDIIPRHRVMKGFDVFRKAGWDTHGLPVELEVEKKLGLSGKQDIEKYGMEAFIKECKESVWKYKSEWEEMSERVGFFVDYEKPYVTYDDNYIESVWWGLKQFADKDMLYKGYKVVPYCPRCGTALSSHEVAQGYEDVKDRTVFVKFALKNEPNTFFVAWTTTPWTLPSNVALCFNPAEDYSLIEVEDGSRYILADALAPKHFENYKTISIKKGKEYEHTPYLPPLDYKITAKEGCPPNAALHYAVCDSYVTLDSGTGVVHIAPSYGEDDSRVAKKYNLPFVRMVDDRGLFVDAAEDIKGLFAKDADKFIIKNLKASGALLKEMLYEHSYPHCWRCHTPLLYYARGGWFLKMESVKQELLKSNADINWLPPTIGSGRMGNFLENLMDWCLSRERYWGTPLPVWVCGDCGKFEVFGSKKELAEKCPDASKLPELHRPYIDALHYNCACGGKMSRVPEVLDCWYDSGSMPFAQLHYPFENQDLFNDNVFPAEYISEAVDQTRGWFYSLLAISTVLFKRPPFKNCVVLGHVNDKNGIKMSKHIGNVIAPKDALDKAGADAVRWYFYTGSAPWIPSRFSHEAVSEVQRKYLGTLWNTYAFFVLYADIDKFDPTKYDINKLPLTEMDKWALSELNSLVSYVDNGLENYQITEAARAIQDFTDKLSNWYVRRSRERFWGSGMTEDKAAAFATLHTCLVTVAKLTAPFTPFIAESMYQNLVANLDKTAPISVHLCEYPVSNTAFIDKNLEEKMSTVQKIVELGRTLRNEQNIKNRQPLADIFVYSASDLGLNDGHIKIICEELNVKNFKLVKDISEFSGYELKPQLKTLGPKYGALIGKIREYLATADAAKIVEQVQSNKPHKTVINGVEIELKIDDLLITATNKPGFSVVSHESITAVLNTVLNDGLVDEGYEREIVSKIQTMRKESGLNVTDRIHLKYEASGRSAKVFKAHKNSIASDVLATILEEGTGGDFVREWDINGEKVTLHITKAL